MQSSLVLALLALSLASAKKLPEYRLPGDLVPTRYTLEMVTDLDAFTFAGKVWIELECKTETDSIYLHSRNLTIHEKEVTIKHEVIVNKFKDIPLSGITYEDQNDFMIIKLKEKVTPGKNYVLYIPFDGILSEEFAGYYRSSYIDKNSTK